MKKVIKSKKTIKISIISIVAIILFCLLLFFEIIPEYYYQRGMELYDQGNYELSITYFEKSNGHANSGVMIDWCNDELNK